MPDPRVRAHVIVSGMVQRVWFRQSTAQAANDIGVDGWVRNLEDGRVEAVFEGSPAAVSRAVAYARRGPERARVDDVELTYEPPEGASGFYVR